MIDRTMLRLIVRSVVWCHDCRSFVRSIVVPRDRSTIGRRVPQLIVHSVTWCHKCSYDRSHAGYHYCSYDRSHDATIDRTFGRRTPRLIVRSVVRRNNWSYIGRWSLPLVARFPTMVLAIDILPSFVIARPRVEIDRRMRPLLEILANIADRSHLGPIATNRTIQKSYDPVWLWL